MASDGGERGAAQVPPRPSDRQRKPQQFYAEDFATPDQVTLETIGVMRSPYKERFGTPRQATVWEQSLGNRPQQTEIHLKKGEAFQKALQVWPHAPCREGGGGGYQP